MMTKSLFQTSLSLFLGFAVAMLGPAVPAHADKVKNAIIGIGGAIILNEIIKNQNKGPGKAKQSPGKKTYKKGGGKGGSNASNSVAQTQRALAGLGYNPGPVDGQMGGKTRNAIMAFQRDRGYPATGALTPEQSAALNSAYSLSSQPPAPGQMTAATKYEAQIYLKKLGYNVGKPDGVWGPKSQAALDAFRLDTGTSTHSALLPEDLQALHLKVHGTPATHLAMTGPGNTGTGNVSLGAAPGLGAPSAKWTIRSDSWRRQPGAGFGRGSGSGRRSRPARAESRQWRGSARPQSRQRCGFVRAEPRRQWPGPGDWEWGSARSRPAARRRRATTGRNLTGGVQCAQGTAASGRLYQLRRGVGHAQGHPATANRRAARQSAAATAQRPKEPGNGGSARKIRTTVRRGKPIPRRTPSLRRIFSPGSKRI